jgi:hypothetical protein
VTAVAISAIAVAGTLIPVLNTALRRGSVPGLATVLTVLPTGCRVADRGRALYSVGVVGAVGAVSLVAPVSPGGRSGWVSRHGRSRHEKDLLHDT